MSPTRSSKPAVSPEEKALRAKYAGMLAAVEETYLATPWPLTLTVLICAGANPKMVPQSGAFDEHGYYHRDFQLKHNWKNPWPTDEVRDDALLAAKLEGYPLEGSAGN